MNVVLRADVEGVGKKGDMLQVADGFARNYLIPKGRAIPATAGVQAQAAAMRRAAAAREAREREQSETVARKLVPMVIRIPAKAGPEGRLFGSVSPSDIAEAVADQSETVLDRRSLQIEEPIRSLGAHEVGVKLPGDVQFVLNVEVVKG
ncbi:MAG TPA: 50S ribosomal protein L9 [Acidimicrobiales bacterium]|nr:50S ribosomal protein L9 [Acidimicrobiales bacterium]